MSITAPSQENKLDALRNAVQARIAYEAALDELALVTVGTAMGRHHEVMNTMACELAARFAREDFEPEMVTEQHLNLLDEQLGH